MGIIVHMSQTRKIYRFYSVDPASENNLRMDRLKELACAVQLAVLCSWPIALQLSTQLVAKSTARTLPGFDAHRPIANPHARLTVPLAKQVTVLLETAEVSAQLHRPRLSLSGER